MSEVETSTPEATNEPNYGLLAQKAFGDSYYGEVQEPPTETQEESFEKEEVQETQGEVEDSELTEEVIQEESASEEKGSEEETTASSLSDVLEASGFDQDEFMNLEVEQKINGETRRVKLSEVLATNQTLSAAEQRLEEIKEKAKSQNQQLAQKEQELDQAFSVVQQFFNKQASQLKERLEAHEKDPLRKQDPAEWAAKKLEIQSDIQNFQQEVMGYSQAYQQQKAKTAQETEAQKTERLEKEYQALLEQMPEWQDDDVREEGQKKLSNYLAEKPLSDDAYKAINESSALLVMAEKARAYDEIQAKADPAKKKLVKVPKTLKPGSKPKQADPNQSEISKIQSWLRDNPNHRDATRMATKLMRLKRGN